MLLAGEGDFNMKTTLSHDQNENKNYNYHKNNEQCIIIISTEQTAATFYTTNLKHFLRLFVGIRRCSGSSSTRTMTDCGCQDISSMSGQL